MQTVLPEVVLDEVNLTPPLILLCLWNNRRVFDTGFIFFKFNKGLAIIGASMANKGTFKDMKVLSQEGWHAMHDKGTTRKMFGYKNCSPNFLKILFLILQFGADQV